MNKIDTSPLADSNTNYSIIHKIIQTSKNKHIPSNLFLKQNKAYKVDYSLNNQINELYRDKLY